MAKKKKEEEVVEDKPSSKKKVSKVNIQKTAPINIEKYSISELIEEYKIKPVDAVAFLNYYGLSEQFKKEFESNESEIKFSEGEFEDMYKRFMEREI